MSVAGMNGKMPEGLFGIRKNLARLCHDLQQVICQARAIMRLKAQSRLYSHHLTTPQELVALSLFLKVLNILSHSDWIFSFCFHPGCRRN
jgi:hypothetical protein